MTEEQERQAFLSAIKKDRYDEPTRRVFADWLEEHGEDDLALAQRKWTSKWQEAEDYLTDLAARCGETCLDYYGSPEEKAEEWRRITLEDLVQAGKDWAETAEITEWGLGGEQFVQEGQEGLRNALSDKEEAKRFWRHWQAYTELTIPEEKQGNPFSCTC